MIYYLYKITNLVNNKIYVGVHKTKNINDGYMGSGKVIKDSIRKYGIDNFRKDILEYFDNSEFMYAREKELVTNEFLLREDVYNLRRGGYGGFDYINKFLLDECKYIRSANINNIPIEKKSLGGKITGSENIKKGHVSGKIKYDNFSGKLHSKETKQKMSISAKKRIGDKNSQYGSFWITDGKENKKLKSGEIMPEGWYKGRKVNKPL